QRALLFDDDDQVETLREIGELLPADRPYARNFEEPQTQVITFDLVDAQLIQCLAPIEISFTRRDDTDFRRAAAGGNDAVELIGANKRQHRIALEIVKARLLPQYRVDEADIETAFGHSEVGRRDNIDAIQPSIYDPGRLDGFVHALERGPYARETRHGPSVQRVINNLLDAGRIEDR